MVSGNQRNAAVHAARPYVLQALAFVVLAAGSVWVAVRHRGAIEAAGGLSLGENNLLSPTLEMGAAACAVGLLICLGIGGLEAFGARRTRGLESRDLPPLEAAVSVDRRVVEVHLLRDGAVSLGGYGRAMGYLKGLLGAFLLLGGVTLVLALIGFASSLPAWHQIAAFQDRNWRTGQSLSVALPMLLFGVPMTLVAMRLLRHGRIEIHPNGVTVVGALRRHTFEDSPATVVLARKNYLGDRRTGRQMNVSHLYAPGVHKAVRAALDCAVVVEEPTRETAAYLPWYERSPGLLAAPLIAFFLWLVMLGVNVLS